MNIKTTSTRENEQKPSSSSAHNPPPVTGTTPFSTGLLSPRARGGRVGPTPVPTGSIPGGGDAELQQKALLRRRRSVEDALARVRETLFEVLEESPAPLSAADGLFETIFGGPGPSDGREQAHDPDTNATRSPPPISGVDRRPGIETLPEPRNQPGFQEVRVGEVIVDDQPMLDARRQLISDELNSIFECVETRWQKICARLRQDLRRRYGQFVDDCKSCLDAETCESERQLLRRDMAEARRDLMAELEQDYWEQCRNFDDWRKSYLDQELKAVSTQEHYRVLSTVLRYEIIHSMPQLEEEARDRAASLWKELLDIRALGDACLDLEPLRYSDSSHTESGKNA